jgi:hypothetical protein
MSPGREARMVVDAPRGSAVDPDTAIDLLRGWLSGALAAAAMQWLDAEIARQRDGTDERRLGMALGLVGRRIGRKDLALSPGDLAAARMLRAGWRPDLWGTDEAARVAIFLATARADDAAFAERVDRLCATGELTEHVAYLKGFAVFPAPARLLGRAREAVRSSAQPVFQAIVCHNPYPANHFDEAAWNHAVVKCVFSGLPIETIVGLDERRNDDLIHMLRDLVSERHAAGRTLPATVHRFIDGARVTE